jgi:diadenylate cyclase
MFGAVIIFQPEIRKFLGYLGQSNFFHTHFNLKRKNLKEVQKVNVLKELIESVKYLSKTRTGALVVLERNDDINSYSDVGTQLEALLSTELLLTIFHTNTPLHDGAVVISGDLIKSAGVLLPLTEDPKLSWKYGTRHRAAIGMSEISDAACLVVSEETGDVSIALDGSLKKYDDITQLKKDLEILLGYEEEDVIEENKTVFNFIKIKTKKQANQLDKKKQDM